MIKLKNVNGKLVQFLAALCINFATLVYGIVVGWPSPTMSILLAPDSPLPSGPVTKEQIALVSSVMSLGGMIGGIVFGWIGDYLGRKWSLILGTVPQFIAFVLIAVAEDVNYLYISRFLSGVAGGALFILAPIYVSEIAESSIRGMLGTILGLYYNIGVIVANIICAYMPFYSVPYVVLAFLLFFGFYIFFPESPQYLLLKRKEGKAKEALKFFRGSSNNDQFTAEFETMKASINASNTKKNILLEDFKPTTTKKAMLVTFILLCGRNFSGVFPLMNYTVSIFEEAGTGLDANISAIIVAVLQLLGTLASFYFTDKTGRRILLISSLLGAAICFSLLGIYFVLKSQAYDLSSFFWLPILSLSGCFFLAAGILNIPMYVMAELLPVKIRSFVATVFVSITWPMNFTIIQYYSSVADALGTYSCMWIFAGWCFFEAIFAYFLLPETKGKDSDEIIQALQEKPFCFYKKK